MNKKLDWMKDLKWGIFTHYLYHEQNKAGSPTNMGKGCTDWNDCVNEFDTEMLAEQVAETGASYLFFTVMQGTRFMCAPNKTFDNITGCKPGEACSERDLIADLIVSLKKRNIALFLYYTGDGPHFDTKCGPAMGFVEPRQNVPEDFIKKWAAVAEEYSLRYGENVHGWWVDGCYTYFGYNDDKIGLYVPALRAGNPDSLLSFNGGVGNRVFKYSVHDDFTCGEMNMLYDFPDNRFIDGSQWFTLAPLGLPVGNSIWESWCKPGSKYTSEYLADYITKVNNLGGVVTIDVGLYRDGHIDPVQIETLKKMNI